MCLRKASCSALQGSRNGHAPIYMWYTLTRKGYEGMRKDVQKCLRNAHLLKVCACDDALNSFVCHLADVMHCIQQLADPHCDAHAHCLNRRHVLTAGNA